MYVGFSVEIRVLIEKFEEYVDEFDYDYNVWFVGFVCFNIWNFVGLFVD